MLDALLLTTALFVPIPQDPAPMRVVAVATAPHTIEMSREETASKSPQAHDLRGELPSLYHGIYYHPDQEVFRKCVAGREGSFTYMVRGGDGDNYYGTYQMSAALVRGASWMMAAESKKTHDGLYREARRLHGIPGNKWSRYWQDRAFYTILNYEHKWSGKGHWAGGRWHC